MAKEINNGIEMAKMWRGERSRMKSKMNNEMGVMAASNEMAAAAWHGIKMKMK